MTMLPLRQITQIMQIVTIGQSTIGPITIGQILLMLLAWGMLVNLMFTALQGIRNGILTIRRLHQIPCSRCRFFANSPYLKCPVHPTIALSPQAIHCRDFE